MSARLTVAVVLCTLAVTSRTALAASPPSALLVGCSKYQDDGIRKLPGAENDVRQFEQLLQSQFGCREIITLAGWPSDTTKRPTCANIHAAFEHLITTAEPGSQVIILMAGHGFRFPLPDAQTDVLDPSNPEPDGLDEAFLPADYDAGQNRILDNQFGVWLDRFKAKDVHVWLIFDTCFSGSMSRGSDAANSRVLSPSEARVSLDAIRAAQLRAEKEIKMTNKLPADGLVAGQGANTGSVVVLFAAQNFETAPEVTRPKGASTDDPLFRHGLLSYHLQQELCQRRKSLTYRELAEAIVARYRSDGHRSPTPYFEGDLDRQVLGQQEWPQTQTIHFVRDSKARLTGGQLAGLWTNTVLAALRRDEDGSTTTLGYVKVCRATSDTADIEPIEFAGVSKPELATLPDVCEFRIVSQDLASAQLKLHLMSIEAGPSEIADRFTQSAKRLLEGDRGAIQVVDRLDEADWVFAHLTPRAAARLLGIDAPEAVGVLLAAEDFDVLAPDDFDPMKRTWSNEIPHALVRAPTLNDPDQLAHYLATELEKIQVWHNFWRVTGAYGGASGITGASDIHLEIAKLKDVTDHSDGSPIEGNRLRVGDVVVIRVANTGYEPCWYSVFSLDGRFGINHLATGSIRGRIHRAPQDTRVVQKVRRYELTSNSIRTNGFVVIAVRQKVHPLQPDYRFLVQAPLGVPLTRASVQLNQVRTPFEQLLLTASSRHGERMRSVQSPEEPQISSWSWITVP